VEKITVRQRCSGGEKVLSLNAVQRIISKNWPRLES